MGRPRPSASTPLLDEKTPYKPQTRRSVRSMLSRLFRRAPPAAPFIALDKQTAKAAVKALVIPSVLLPTHDRSSESIALSQVTFLASGFFDDARNWQPHLRIAHPASAERRATTQLHLLDARDWNSQSVAARMEGAEEMRVAKHAILNTLIRSINSLFGTLHEQEEHRALSTRRFLAQQAERLREENQRALSELERQTSETTPSDEPKRRRARNQLKRNLERAIEPRDAEEGWNDALNELAWRGMLKALSRQEAPAQAEEVE